MKPLKINAEKWSVPLDRLIEMYYSIYMIKDENNNDGGTKMKTADLRIMKIGGSGMTTKALFLVPIQLDASWTWYERYNAYGKAESNQAAALALRAEILARCTDI